MARKIYTEEELKSKRRKSNFTAGFYVIAFVAIFIGSMVVSHNRADDASRLVLIADSARKTDSSSANKKIDSVLQLVDSSIVENSWEPRNLDYYIDSLNKKLPIAKRQKITINFPTKNEMDEDAFYTLKKSSFSVTKIPAQNKLSINAIKYGARVDSNAVLIVVMALTKMGYVIRDISPFKSIENFKQNKNNVIELYASEKYVLKPQLKVESISDLQLSKLKTHAKE